MPRIHRVAALIAFGLLPAAAQAQDFTVTAGVTAASNYVFRSVTFSNDNAAIQPYVELSYKGFYGGLWASNVDFGPGTTDDFEVDYSLGYRGETTGGFSYDFTLAGEPHRWGDYAIGEQIDHGDGVTIEEAEHMLATRLWQNTAKVHFDATLRADGRRLIYGGHVISIARALSFNGLANAQMMVALNGGAHANPCFAGDTVRAWSEVLERAGTAAPGVGALRLRTVATRQGAAPFALKGADGRYLPEVLLDLDYWVLIPC